MRVLVIEDDPETAEFIGEGLVRAGHVVAHAADGAAGLQLAATEHVDVLGLDRRVPRMDGLTFSHSHQPRD